MNAPGWVTALPAVNAALNATALVLLLIVTSGHAILVDLRERRFGIASRCVVVLWVASLGVAWAVTELEGDYVDGVLVGDDGVMVFVHSFDEPDVTRVLLGRQ